MNRILSGLTVALCLGAAEGSALAQAAQPEYHVVLTYIKTAPGMQDAYRDHLVNVSSKFYGELLKEQPNLMGWSAASAMFDGVDSRYDYVTATIYSGLPPEPSTPADALYQRAAGMTRAEYVKKLATMRTVVGTELLSSISRSMAPGTARVGDFRVTQQLKAKPGMGNEVTDLLRTRLHPMMDMRRTAGELKSWGAWARQFPGGTSSTYDVLLVNTYKDMASALKGLDASKTADVFAKANPGKSYATYVNDARDYAEVAVRGLTRVVALVERPAAQ
ncbi:hypothetical protein TBR22_A46470 [Luteitalea sp. TBR-22]|uniref:hypothetical protein n=1 Tax=Luteitalea sp. TBR-22 TaxID=2802971 RepID=UPI001AF866B7|nr:hypothetical protein [Luteitalea sp. TBR-22]BCS35420.1 hypothetical protein TBR22_A46470 [Luteitalea sp. TBR-22]